jgi:hypothetical protein
MIQTILTFPATGNAAINFSAVVPAGQAYQLISLSVLFSAAPTTSEDLTVTFNSHYGAVYDVLLYTVDPSAGATTDIFWQPDEEIDLVGGDAVDVAYANTDTNTYGAVLTLKAV